MLKYRSKETGCVVRAFLISKIKAVGSLDGTPRFYDIVSGSGNYCVRVTDQWVLNHKPTEGDYFIRMQKVSAEFVCKGAIFENQYVPYDEDEEIACDPGAEEGDETVVISYDPAEDEEKPNTVTKQHIEALIDSAKTQEHIFLDKELLVSYRLPNGFTITGRGACVDPANFDIEKGRKAARQDAINQLWPLEGYLLQQRLWEQRKSSSLLH